ncbi:MAG: 3-deoxy-7-phosphoheptulonate synthase [Sedimentisphaerales bacterium]|nr:3-deoxy-7-phosphoheptulonate synthase [Sedimentisphaerales bacterium]MBN2842892.1 3-deoxy-7-phosphoheptulonate synthase [Sedimentisphaerales bacterium]
MNNDTSCNIPSGCEIDLSPAHAKPAAMLYSRKAQATDTIIDINGVKIGGRGFAVIAGPCSVESRQQLFATAYGVHAAGAVVFRGGAFKPRTSPYSFQGGGQKALDLLKDVNRELHIPIITEVMDTEDLEAVCQSADILQIGSRNCQNFSLLKKAGRTGKPILLKRGYMNTVDEFLLSAEYILAEGNPNVILCERGIRTFETSTRNTLDIAAIPVLKDRTHLPVVVDPSHACGHSQYVPALAKAAMAAGADGLIVEVHIHPETALCDGEQSLSPNQFAELMDDLRIMAPALNRKLA